jgi:hypothetical protein
MNCSQVFILMGLNCYLLLVNNSEVYITTFEFYFVSPCILNDWSRYRILLNSFVAPSSATHRPREYWRVYTYLLTLDKILVKFWTDYQF